MVLCVQSDFFQYMSVSNTIENDPELGDMSITLMSKIPSVKSIDTSSEVMGVATSVGGKKSMASRTCARIALVLGLAHVPAAAGPASQSAAMATDNRRLPELLYVR